MGAKHIKTITPRDGSNEVPLNVPQNVNYGFNPKTWLKFKQQENFDDFISSYPGTHAIFTGFSFLVIFLIGVIFKAAGS